MKTAALMLLCCGALRAETWSYWIQPCEGDIARESECRASDPELGAWALQAWQKAAGRALTVVRTPEEKKARLRIYWVSGRSQLYGETRGIEFDGRRGAEVYVLPSVAAGSDALMREAIVYLTCLHESGHAFGLPHTRAFEDIMYSFQYGGDIPAYFGRYRQTLTRREDIRNSSGLSANDRAAIMSSLR